MSTQHNSGILYIVGTPIGNIQDISFRAVDVLKNCDLILAEDTRHSIYLLQNFGIPTSLKSYHQHNEQERVAQIIDLLNQNKKIALITDAGMPGISDPGYILVKAVLENNLRVSVIPGPTAVTSAISISGIDCREFYFAGFLSSKSAARLQKLTNFSNYNKTTALVIYEAPHRLIDCLQDIQAVFGPDKKIAAIKELTKIYEHIYSGSVSDILDQLSKLDAIKGEYVIIISGESEDSTNLDDQEILKALALFKAEDINTKSAVKIIAELFKLKKNHVYDLALKTK